MNDDELRARLAAIDPARAGGAYAHLPEPTPDEVKELAMSIIDSQSDSQSDAQPDSRSEATPDSLGGPRRPRLLAAAAVLTLLAGVVAAALLTRDGATIAPDTMALKTQSSAVMASCVQFDVAILRDMPVAFGGTVTAVDDSSVTVGVDRWFRGGSAEQVVISKPDANSSLSLDGVAFERGERYLITATDGTVNYCGFSGPATPELEQAFEQAFPG